MNRWKLRFEYMSYWVSVCKRDDTHAHQWNLSSALKIDKRERENVSRIIELPARQRRVDVFSWSFPNDKIFQTTLSQVNTSWSDEKFFFLADRRMKSN